MTPLSIMASLEHFPDVDAEFKAFRRRSAGNSYQLTESVFSFCPPKHVGFSFFSVPIIRCFVFEWVQLST